MSGEPFLSIRLHLLDYYFSKKSTDDTFSVYWLKATIYFLMVFQRDYCAMQIKRFPNVFAREVVQQHYRSFTIPNSGHKMLFFISMLYIIILRLINPIPYC